MRRWAVLNTRTALLAGFGGVLALMFFTGLDATRVVSRIRKSEANIGHEYRSRHRLLDQIRSDLYVSGTYVRDYVMDPEVNSAEIHRSNLEATRRRMDAALAEYERLMTRDEAGPYFELRRKLQTYWRILNPVFSWTPAQRRDGGYLFLQTQVFPRRTAMLGVAGQIASINDRLLNLGERRVAELFTDFQRRLLLVLVVTMAVGLLLAAITMRQILLLEAEAARRFEETAAAREELKHLSAKLVAAQENERRSLSRELHDEVGQSMSAVLVELGNLSAALPPDASPTVRRHAEIIRSLMEASLAAVRNLALLLRPSMLDDLGLIPALEWQARETFRRTGIRVNVAAGSVSDELPEAYKTCVYRVVQEALHNCERHAAARKVRITVQQEECTLFLSVHDDGKGFDVHRERGLGLLGMQERISNLGGNFRIESQRGEGTLLSVVLPIAAAPAAEHEVTA